MENTIISGAYDLHVHTSPDYQPRKLDDAEMARRVIDAGMAGYAIKSHFSCTTDRAYLINRLFPGCHAVGTLCLNRFLGGINPLAVDIAARVGAKIVWFPTKDGVASLSEPERSAAYADILSNQRSVGTPVEPVRVLNDDGGVLPEVYAVLDVIAQHDLIMGTGHLSVPEAVALVKAARERKVRKIVMTHISAEGVYGPELQRELLKQGVYMEHCVHSVATERVPFEEMLEQIKLAGPDRVIISTDFGQPRGGYPDEGLLSFCERLLRSGMSETDVRKMIVGNPEALLGIK